MDKKYLTIRALVKDQFDKAVAERNGQFESIDTHNFSIGLAAVFNENVQTLERYLRRCKAAKRLELIRAETSNLKVS